MKVRAILFHAIVAAMCSPMLVACGDDNDGKGDNVVPVTVTIDRDAVILSEGETLQLTAVADNGGDIVWTSTDEAVATVDADGLVSAVSSGQVEIVATCGSGKQTCVVVVKGYTLVWSDEFDGTSLDRSVWNVETGGTGWGNQEAQYYTDREDNIKVQDGNLVITVRKEEYGNKSYTSGRITTKNNKDFTYGKVQARIKLPKGGGTWPAFWMLGYGSWPYCGEIDIMEHVGNNPNMVSFALHTNVANGSRGNNWHSQPTIAGIEDDFHVFGVEWVANYAVSKSQTRSAILFTVDGEVLARSYQSKIEEDKASWPFFNPFYIILNVAMGGTMGGSIDDSIFANQDSQPVQMLVDWVRVYQIK